MPVAAQKEIEGGDVVQKYQCPNASCAMEYTSLQVFDLIDPAAARMGDSLLRCGICGTEIEQVIGEAGGQLGTQEDRRERIKVRRDKCMMIIFRCNFPVTDVV